MGRWCQLMRLIEEHRDEFCTRLLTSLSTQSAPGSTLAVRMLPKWRCIATQCVRQVSGLRAANGEAHDSGVRRSCILIIVVTRDDVLACCASTVLTANEISAKLW